MTTIVTINGASRSGKDEVTSLLKQFGYKHIHPLSNLYVFLEEHFELPKGSLMEGSSKSFKPCGSDNTMAELLVDFYHFMKDRDVNWTIPHVRRALDWNIKHKQSLVFSGLRNFHESRLILDKVRDVREDGEEIRLVSAWINRPGFGGFSSDVLQRDIFDELTYNADKTLIIDNDDTLAAFLNKIKNLIKEHSLDGRRITEAKSN